MMMRMDSVCDASEITYGFEAVIGIALPPFHTRPEAAEFAHEVNGSDGERERQRGGFEIEDGLRKRCGSGCEVSDDEASRLPATDDDKAGHAEFANLLRRRVGQQLDSASPRHTGERSAAVAAHGGGGAWSPRESRALSR